MTDGVTFGTLRRDGAVENVRVILDPAHYRQDGSCRCDDKSHAEMGEWGYKWGRGRWM